MTEQISSTYPYTLEVQPNSRVSGMWQWAIRKHGKLIQRSDRELETEDKALAHGTSTIQKLLLSRDDGRY